MQVVFHCSFVRANDICEIEKEIAVFQKQIRESLSWTELCVYDILAINKRRTLTTMKDAQNYATNKRKSHLQVWSHKLRETGDGDCMETIQYYIKQKHWNNLIHFILVQTNLNWFALENRLVSFDARSLNLITIKTNLSVLIKSKKFGASILSVWNGYFKRIFLEII